MVNWDLLTMFEEGVSKFWRLMGELQVRIIYVLFIIFPMELTICWGTVNPPI